jgi:hypothetical protein
MAPRRNRRRTWTLNPADVMDFPLGLLDEMDRVLKDEARARRIAERRAKARGRR